MEVRPLVLAFLWMEDGTIEVGMSVTGAGISGSVTVTEVTDQNNIVLSSAQTLSDDAALCFSSSDFQAAWGLIKDDLLPGILPSDTEDRFNFCKS